MESKHMRNNKVLNIITSIMIVASIIMAFFLYETVKGKNKITYVLSDMKTAVNDEGKDQILNNEINEVKVIDINFPFIKTSIESTATDCSTIGSSIFQKYQVNTLKNNISEMEFDGLQYESNKIIKGNLKDFLIEITFNTRYLKDDANLLKNSMIEGKNRPLFRTRFHIKVTDKPFTYELVEIGKDLGR
ncbi:hypothetical protein KPL35_03995 [Clostridium sp. CF011]|uniref:hypothetical protein n=1 Tax=Clostridium sp. CF011 TaxID=2843318 RepID=UPI001C0D6A13|nr:hypothetical protein [Clostridium sp. CF011]MBU3091232.1 hypothetical protein [Clostridium sp. CF011]WAG68541.1 hypothetical protein LL036_10530 [Clostridium sp. CF011]